MKRFVSLLATLCLMQGAHSQTTAVPGFISYQGRALNSAGTVMGSGTPVNRLVTFRIWDHASSSLPANLVYSEQQVVTIAEGEFSVLLGAGSATPLELTKGPQGLKIEDPIVLAGVNRYLGVTIDDGTPAVDNEVSPRQRIVASAYALRAKVAESVDGLAITTAMLANSSVTTNQVGNAAITTSKLAASAVTATQIADATITTAKIADGIITSAKILDGTIATADLADGSITTAKIADGTIATADLAASSITTAKIADGTIATADIALGAVIADRIATDAILAANIAAGAVGTSELATGVNISAGAISTTGSVGIGTASPAYKLDVAGTARMSQNLTLDSQLLMAESACIYGKNTSGVLENVFWPRAGNGTYISYGTNGFWIRNNAGTITMYMLDNGNVAIGSPAFNDARLNVGSISSAIWLIGYLDSNGGQSGDSIIARPVSIKADGVIVSPLVAVTSDVRIKTDLHPTDSLKDLETLMEIQITNYKYKDTIANGKAPQKKVIAQQLETIYPQAVITQKGVVPDIFKNATVKDGWIELATDLKAGERVRLISASGESLEEVLEVRDGAFRSSLKAGAEKAFVYGREVSDMRSVDYDAIAMLNVSATQELVRQLKTVQDENAALRRDLAAKDESMEARLIALERRLTQGGVPETVSIKTVNAAK